MAGRKIFILLAAASLAADEGTTRFPTDFYEDECGLAEGCGCFARNAPCARGVSIGFDSLWWNAQNHGLSSGIDRISESESKILRMHPEWAGGMRASLGWNPRYDRWDVSFIWTWYRNTSHLFGLRGDLLGATAGDLGYFPSWDPENPNPYRQVRSTWQFFYTCYDLEIGRAFYITRALSLRPFASVRGAYLNQQFSNSFFDPISQGVPIERDVSENWWGVGPKLGLSAGWHLGLGLVLVGKASSALLFGEADAKLRCASCNLTPTVADSFNQLTPNLDMFLGLQWESILYRQRIFFSVNAGWEASYWWNQCAAPLFINSAQAPLPTVGNQPVTMEGLTISLHLDF